MSTLTGIAGTGSLRAQPAVAGTDRDLMPARHSGLSPRPSSVPRINFPRGNAEADASFPARQRQAVHAPQQFQQQWRLPVEDQGHHIVRRIAGAGLQTLCLEAGTARTGSDSLR